MRSSLVLTSLVLLTACAKSVDPGQDISGPTTSQEVVSGAVMGAAVNGASVMPNVLFILVDDMGFGDRSVYAEMVTQVDTGIGKILDTLKSENLLENTIVVFSSDNGGALTTGASNGALAGGKGQAY